jgi:haloalkane dehalogenase
VTNAIASEFPYELKHVSVLNSEMAYVDEGDGDAIIFLHGIPTSSYLWRNVIPHLTGSGRCLAPDMPGMGASGKIPSGSYRFTDVLPYMDAWFEAVGPINDAVLVLHDWGGGYGFDWARRNESRVAGIVYMETTVTPRKWEDFEGLRRDAFEAMRAPGKGEKMVLEANMFIEKLLPGLIIRTLSDTEMNAYRAPFPEPADRQPLLDFPRQVPIDGEPPESVELIETIGEWAAESDVPKLLISAEPGGNMDARQLAFCRQWPNQEEVTVKGKHFIQEDSPHEIGEAIAAFVGKVRE